MMRVSSERIRLDKFVQEAIKTTWGQSQRVIQDGFVKVNGKRTKEYGMHLRKDDEVEIRCHPSQSPKDNISRYIDELKDREGCFQKLKDMIIYEDDEIVVLNKPSGYSSQGGQSPHKNLPHLVQNYFMMSNQTSCSMKLVHRLDQPVSGAIIFAKSREAASLYGNLIQNDITKQYICLVEGIPNKIKGLIDAPIIYSGKHQKSFLNSQIGQQARTQYEVLETSASNSLLRIQLLEGRKHQIRAHLSQVLGTPILYDQKYGHSQQSDEGIALHSHKLIIKQAENKQLEIQAPIIGVLGDLLKKLQFKIVL